MNPTEILFKTIRENISKEDSEIISIIKEDSNLLATSNSFCIQCGDCCNTRCSNIESERGLSYCLLHEEDYPNDKRIPDYSDVYEELDSEIFTKPLVCHTYGPHLGLLSMIRGKDTICSGSIKMFREYRKNEGILAN